MKKSILSFLCSPQSLALLIFCCLIFSAGQTMAQGVVFDVEKDTASVYRVIKNDGASYTGKILRSDSKEVLIRTTNLGDVSIPKHEIREIVLLPKNKNGAIDLPGELFATRYFITTNGLPLEKGESYIIWNLYGPDFQFGVSKDFSLGLMTTWLGVPIIASAKYSVSLGEGTSLGLGALLGTGSWALPQFGVALPYAVITLGDKQKNISLSGGYGAVYYRREVWNISSQTSTYERFVDGRFLGSVAGMIKLARKFTFVFDSFIVPPGPLKTYTQYQYVNGAYVPYPVSSRAEGFALFFPGVRWQLQENRAFQFGFAAIGIDDELSPFPFPMVQWFRKF